MRQHTSPAVSALTSKDHDTLWWAHTPNTSASWYAFHGETLMGYGLETSASPTTCTKEFLRRSASLAAAASRLTGSGKRLQSVITFPFQEA
ncbi:hypothetical protein KBW71_26205 [Hydrogenophaga aromaticivorans]|uniref:hypothetical protein n=1 Tax=Hydrogenophaga aromaticivorans TaxID=2610898 RepID=UPI001B35BEE6|nr:hypothetical protein [Hydrogenophaga aromaticivorans]MBQ0921945.1 hypothetical protein [Hydrogenophaga aromaticivorans]